jgi:PPM family protein phosphatase
MTRDRCCAGRTGVWCLASPYQSKGERHTARHETIGARAEQQDAAGSAPLGSGGGAQLLVLADGLGGHADGARASRMVVDTFDEAVRKGQLDEPGGRRQALHGIIQEVNKRIHEATDPTDGHRSMASTAVAAIVANGTVRWISVGDSHLYVCRNGRLSKLNADHSQAGIMIRHGYSPNDEAVINARSVLVSALTGRDIEEIDNPAHDVALEIGDVVLLASDGLNTLSDTEIALAIDRMYDRGAEAIATTLVQMVTERGLPRQDNATVVVSRVLSRGPHSAAEDSPSLPLTEATTRTEIPTTPVATAEDKLPAEAAALTVPAPPPAPAPPVAPEPAAAPGAKPVASSTTATPAIAAPGTPPAAAKPAAAGPSAEAKMARRKQIYILVRIFLTILVAAAIASVILTPPGPS